jgi:hypothetical protein
MLLPKIQRKSMLPAMWRIPPCMNIAISTVSHHAAWSSGTGFGTAVVPPPLLCTRSPTIFSAERSSGVPSQTISSEIVLPCGTAARKHVESPGCVIRYGIAPYSTALWSMPLVSPARSRSRSSGNCHCQMNTATLIAINATVRTGKRSVGRLSRSGIKGGEA